MSVVFVWYKLKAFLSVFCIKGAAISKSEKRLEGIVYASQHRKYFFTVLENFRVPAKS